MSRIQTLTAEIQTSKVQKESLDKSIRTWDRRNIAFIIFAFIAAGGLVITSIELHRLNGQLATVQSALDAGKEELAHAESQASELEIAEVRRQTERERYARIELEAKVAWRSLDEKAREDMATKLKPFAGESATIICNPGDSEGLTFGTGIALALHSAGWRVGTPSEQLMIRGGARIRTGVLITSSDDDPSVRASLTLVSELNLRGFDATATPNPKDFGPHFDRNIGKPIVTISIAHRPAGAQGEYKLRLNKLNKQPLTNGR